MFIMWWLCTYPYLICTQVHISCKICIYKLEFAILYLQLLVLFGVPSQFLKLKGFWNQKNLLIPSFQYLPWRGFICCHMNPTEEWYRKCHAHFLDQKANQKTHFLDQKANQNTPHASYNETLHFLTWTNPKRQKELKLRSTTQLPEYGDDVNSA
jgi:hypothetical protein